MRISLHILSFALSPLLASSLALCTATSAEAQMRITATTCNYARGPMVVATGDIRLGWQMESDRRGDRQTAYRVVVKNISDGSVAYDSGKTPGDESQRIGVPLRTLPNGVNTDGYTWRVMVWDAQDKASRWSSEQTIVPRNADDLAQGSQWIGATTRQKANIPAGRWPNTSFKSKEFAQAWRETDTLSARSIVVRKEFATQKGKKIARARLMIAGMGHQETMIDGQKVSDEMFAPLWSEYDKTVYYNTYDVTDILNHSVSNKDRRKRNRKPHSDGLHRIDVLLGNGFFNVQTPNARLHENLTAEQKAQMMWKRYAKLQTSFGPPQLRARLTIVYADGQEETVVSDDTWQWHVSPLTFNSIYGGESYDARLEEEIWGDAGSDAEKNEDKSEGNGAEKSAPKSVVNGANRNNWHRVVVGDGPQGALRPQTAPGVKIAQRLSINNHDGEWHTRIDGRDVRYARRWLKVNPDSIATASVKTKRTIDKSVLVADMGQNLSGFPQITVSGQRGQKITILVSENLNAQGVCDQRQTGRQHFYEYTLKGDGNSDKSLTERRNSSSAKTNVVTETWHPNFSYYGFRYIQVEGAVLPQDDTPFGNPDGLPVLHDLTSCFVHSSAADAHSFCASDADSLYNNIHRLIVKAERSNMHAVLTDCPHREKLGWLEQTHLCGPSLLHNFDMATYMPKIVRDMADSQDAATGMVPTTAPRYVSFGNLFDDSPEWGSAIVIVPWQYYEHYGDASLLKEHYTDMLRYTDYLGQRAVENMQNDSTGTQNNGAQNARTQNTDAQNTGTQNTGRPDLKVGIVSHGLGDWYDFGPGRAGFAQNTPVSLVATAHYIYDLQIMALAADLCGHPADADRMRRTLKAETDLFNSTFFNAQTAQYGIAGQMGSQTANALPLFLGIVPQEHAARVLDNLIADIAGRGHRLTTGDVGNRYLFMALARAGRSDVVRRLIEHYDAPGYGSQLVQGATTLTEQWDPRQGASWNHFMMAQIDEWMWKYAAGIDRQPGTAGQRHLAIDLDGEGTRPGRFALQTLYGTVAVERRTDGSATVTLPVGCDAVVTKNGREHRIGSGKTEF